MIHARCPCSGWIVAIPNHQKETTMSKGKHGNKEAKKPKKVHAPNPPGLPASLAPTAASMLRPKKR
jgi:hypothetical protein